MSDKEKNEGALYGEEMPDRGSDAASASCATKTAEADKKRSTRRKKSAGQDATEASSHAEAEASDSENSVAKKNTARKRTATKKGKKKDAEQKSKSTEADKTEAPADGGAYGESAAPIEPASAEAFLSDDTATDGADETINGGADGESITPIKPALAEASLSDDTATDEADRAADGSADGESVAPIEPASAEASLSGDTTANEASAPAVDGDGSDITAPIEPASAETSLSDDTSADEADGAADGGAGGEIFEISFFGPEVRILPEGGGAAGAKSPTVALYPDENQLSFFEDVPRAKIPEGPKEIPLFIPKEPKRGAVLRKSQYNPDKPRGVDTVFDFIELFIISLVCVLIVTSFFFRHSKVVGDSMMNTLYNDEHLIISDAFYTPERGDIVVIEDKSINLSATDEAHYALVKRVIGVAGDHVVVNTQGTVFINGERLNEDYVFIDGPVHSRYVDLIVPEGEIFVLGDHRNNSTDSRYFGTVREDCVIGRVLVRVYPFDRFGAVE
ncbi:MAG: signal peptidase I [Clostridia bacterium]|nr:signal peptidase I [Clostridia bacterium]